MSTLKYQFDITATSFQRYEIAPRLQKAANLNDLRAAGSWLRDVFAPGGWLVIRENDSVKLYSPGWDNHRLVAEIIEVEA